VPFEANHYHLHPVPTAEGKKVRLGTGIVGEIISVTLQ
jgi:hypothetical protein